MVLHFGCRAKVDLYFQEWRLPDGRKLSIGGNPHIFMKTLGLKRGGVVSKSELMARGIDRDSIKGVARTVRGYVGDIERPYRYIITVRGVGYRLDLDQCQIEIVELP